MKRTKLPADTFSLVFCAALAGSLTGCTTYVEQPRAQRDHYQEQPRARETYVPPPPREEARVYEPSPAPMVDVEASYVGIRTEADFYEPLSPHGQWVVIGSYGRCWRPSRVDRDWRPYTHGHWERCDAGWYWASDEPWGWATYHYGRWDHSPQHGWYWVPQTQWAPAWVSWHRGGGYVGWAPLYPSARVGGSGYVEVDVKVIAPRAYVFVEERRFMEPVRPTTVVVNNTTIINKTVNITKVKVVNKTVINEGPQTEVIEQVSGRKVKAVQVRELRRKEEAAVVVKHATPKVSSEKKEKKAQAPARSAIEPVETKAVVAQEPRRVEPPVVAPQRTVAPAPRKEVREADEEKRDTKSARDEEKRARKDKEQQAENEKRKPVPAVREAEPQAGRTAEVGDALDPKGEKLTEKERKRARETAESESRQVEQPAVITNESQAPAPRKESRETDEQKRDAKIRQDEEKRVRKVKEQQEENEKRKPVPAVREAEPQAGRTAEVGAASDPKGDKQERRSKETAESEKGKRVPATPELKPPAEHPAATKQPTDQTTEKLTGKDRKQAKELEKQTQRDAERRAKEAKKASKQAGTNAVDKVQQNKSDEQKAPEPPPSSP